MQNQGKDKDIVMSNATRKNQRTTSMTKQPIRSSYRFMFLLKEEYLNNQNNSPLSKINSLSLNNLFLGNNHKVVENLKKGEPPLEHRNIYKNLLDLVRNDPKTNEKNVKKNVPNLILNAYLETDTTDTVEISHGDGDNSPEAYHFRKTAAIIDRGPIHKNNINVKSFSGHIDTTQKDEGDRNQPIIPIWNIENIENMKSIVAIDVRKIPNNQPLLSKRNQILTEFPFNHLIFSPFTLITEDEFWRYLIKLQKGLVYALKNLSSPSDKEIETKKINLSPRGEGD